MSKDPTPTPPPKGGAPQTLEDAIYRSSLSEGNASVKGANPLVSGLITVLSYAIIGSTAYWVATQTKVGKAVIKKTVGIDLTEQAENEPPPPPPPPPPAAAAPVVVAKIDKPQEAPPPPPDPSKDIVPEIAPRELPKEDLSTRYAVAAGSAAAGAGGVAGGGVAGTGMSIAGSQSGGAAKVVDFDYTQMKVKSKPGTLPYPPIARMAKIQGTVIVEMVVGTDGAPVSAKAIEGPPQLRQSSETYAMQWRFEPAMQNGQAVQSRFRLTINYKLM